MQQGFSSGNGDQGRIDATDDRGRDWRDALAPRGSAMNPILRILFSIVIFAIALSSTYATAQTYRFLLLETLGGTYSSASAINNAGQVAGQASTAGDVGTYATVWKDTTATNLGTLGGANSTSGAYAINSAGIVVGYSRNSDDPYMHATVWNGTVASELNTPGGTHSEARGINDAGQIVGTYYAVSQFRIPVLWNDNAATDLYTSWNDGSALAINNAGRIVGGGYAGSTLYGAIRWDGTTPTYLARLSTTSSGASAINDVDQVVGFKRSEEPAYGFKGSSRATLWNGTTETILDTLGGANSFAYGINAAGYVVGASNISGSDAYHATLWIGISAIDLNSFLATSTVSAGWVLTDARGINDDGSIVGNATNSITGKTRAFLLVPTTLPDTAISLNPGWNLIGNGVETALTPSASFDDKMKISSVWKWTPTGTTPGITYPAWAFYTPSMPDGGQAYAASKGYDFLTTINAGEGCWVNAKAALTFYLPAGNPVQSSSFMPAAGLAAGGAHALRQGWNLIATGDSTTPAQFNSAIATAFSTPPSAGQVSTNLMALWAWSAAQQGWYFWAPSLFNSGGLAAYLTSKSYLDFATMPTTPTGTLSPTTGFWVSRP